MKTSFSHFPLQTSNNSTKQKTQFNSLSKSTKSFFHLIISTQQIIFFFSSTLFLQSITNTNTFFDHSKLFTNIHNNKQNHPTTIHHFFISFTTFSLSIQTDPTSTNNSNFYSQILSKSFQITSTAKINLKINSEV